VKDRNDEGNGDHDQKGDELPHGDAYPVDPDAEGYEDEEVETVAKDDGHQEKAVFSFILDVADGATFMHTEQAMKNTAAQAVRTAQL
jgi:hypothetical protein